MRPADHLHLRFLSRFDLHLRLPGGREGAAEGLPVRPGLRLRPDLRLRGLRPAGGGGQTGEGDRGTEANPRFRFRPPASKPDRLTV